MKRITYLSNGMICLFSLYLIWQVLSFVATWYFCGVPLSGSVAFNIIYSSVPFFSSQSSSIMTTFPHLPVIWKTVTGFVNFFNLVLSLWMTLSLIDLFKLYGRSQIFDVWSVRIICNIGWLFFAIQILYVLSNTLEIYLSTFKTNPIFSITFSAAEAKAIALGLIVLVVSEIMYEGNKLQKAKLLSFKHNYRTAIPVDLRIS